MIKAVTKLIGKSPEFHNSDDDGNTILIGVDDADYKFISGFEIIKFSAEDKVLDLKSFLSNNMTSISMAVGEKYIYFISNHYKFIENVKIEDGTLLNESVDTIDVNVLLKSSSIVKFIPFTHMMMMKKKS